MKSKLITILSSCSALAAIAPVSLLCGCGVKISWSKGETYTPMAPKEFTEDFGDIEAVTVAYHDDLLNNKKIWCDDKIYHFYLLSQDEPETYNIQKLSCTMHKVGDVEDYTRTEGTTNKIFRVDFDIKMTADITYDGIDYHGILKFNNRYMKFKNIPVMAYYDNTRVSIKANAAMVVRDKKWSINYPELIIDSETMTISIGSQNKTYSYDYWPKIGNVLAGLMQKTIDMETNYYSKAKVN